jgi:AcrR family transcriptional regulator
LPRIAEHRAPAEPTTPEQHERVQRILRAAAHHGAAKGLERMQMADVARDAGVAIATLYRYFPSKTALFTGVMRDRVQRLRDNLEDFPSDEPVEAVAELLVRAGRELLRRPLLAHAMMTSNNALAADPHSGVTEAFKALLYTVAGIAEPTEDEARLLRIVEQAWYGILTTVLNGVIDAREAEVDTRLATRLLLGDLWNGRISRSPKCETERETWDT